jgi:hypothetical protein
VIEILQNNLFHVQLCSDEPIEKVVEFANQRFTGNWSMVPESFCADPNPNSCDNNSENKHYVLWMEAFYGEQSNETSRDESPTMPAMPESN